LNHNEKTINMGKSSMAFLPQLNEQLDQYHLLKHPFYQAWSAGQLELETLQEYAKQYYHHVNDFPRYLSAIHTQVEDIETRQIILGNLIDEEQGEENHPELWLRFAESLGVTREEAKNVAISAKTQALLDGYREICASSPEAGIGALYAYERQVPEVAKSKIDGLEKFYAITSEKGLKFFKVHITADEWHAAECAELMEALPEEKRKEAKRGAIAAMRLLWEFLDGMQEHRATAGYIDAKKTAEC
jgi:pyrroloquinoline-quinone synthase